MWKEFMEKAIQKYPASSFIDPQPIDSNVKPVIRGIWENPSGVHEILHWVNTRDPLGSYPSNPASDPQYILWEEPVQKWLNGESFDSKTSSNSNFKIVNPEPGKSYSANMELFVAGSLAGGIIQSGEVFLNGTKIGDLNPEGGIYSFIPNNQSASKQGKNEVKINIKTTDNQEYSDTVLFTIN